MGKVLDMQKRILREFEKEGKIGLADKCLELEDKYLKKVLTRGAGAWDGEILVIYESTMLWLENYGLISWIEKNGEFICRLNNYEQFRKLIELNKGIFIDY